MGTLYLITADGLSLGLQKGPVPDVEESAPYYLYQDLCPVQPLVISSMPLKPFGEYMVSDEFIISLPALCYCDLKVVNMDDPVNTGNVGPLYNHNLRHLQKCIDAITVRGKKTKIMERTFAGRFTYQTIKSGIAFVNKTGQIWYAMPDEQTLAEHHYDWARSAMII